MSWTYQCYFFSLNTKPRGVLSLEIPFLIQVQHYNFVKVKVKKLLDVECYMAYQIFPYSLRIPGRPCLFGNFQFFFFANVNGEIMS